MGRWMGRRRRARAFDRDHKQGLACGRPAGGLALADGVSRRHPWKRGVMLCCAGQTRGPRSFIYLF